MVQVVIVRLIGYREWTYALGFDREHLIQIVQARIHERLVEEFSRLNAWAHPFRYDHLIAVTSMLPPSSVKAVLERLRPYSPVPLSAGVYASDDPREAEANATKLAYEARPWEVLHGGHDDGYVCMAHVDLADSRCLTEKSSYSVYEAIVNMMGVLNESLKRYGALSFYLGGDNIVVILRRSFDEGVLEELAYRYGIRIGVGIARSGRTAMMLATEALDKLRELGRIGVLTFSVL